MDSFFRACSSNHIAKSSECFYSMLRIIIIPRNTIIIEECEKLVTIFSKTFFILYCYFTFIIPLVNLFVESFDENLMFFEQMFFQPKSVNGLNHGLQQHGKLSCHLL